MSKAQELADKLDFYYADNGSGYNSEWTQGLQDAATLLRTQDALLRQALDALEHHERMTRPITYTIKVVNMIKEHLK